MIKLYTETISTATDQIRFGIIRRHVIVNWKSGSWATYTVPRRSQLIALGAELIGRKPSWGTFANWCKERDAFGMV